MLYTQQHLHICNKIFLSFSAKLRVQKQIENVTRNSCICSIASNSCHIFFISINFRFDFRHTHDILYICILYEIVRVLFQSERLRNNKKKKFVFDFRENCLHQNHALKAFSLYTYTRFKIF